MNIPSGSPLAVVAAVVAVDAAATVKHTPPAAPTAVVDGRAESVDAAAARVDGDADDGVAAAVAVAAMVVALVFARVVAACLGLPRLCMTCATAPCPSAVIRAL